MRKIRATILIILALALATFTLSRNFYFPTSETELKITNPTLHALEVPSSSLPSLLLIPRLDIEAKVQHLGVTETGNMAAPTNLHDVSWYKFGTPPGTRGSAVMAGHEDNALTVDGVFKHLHKLEVGDQVVVVTRDGKRLNFEVTRSEIYPYDQVPLQEVFNKNDGTFLNLITCAGEWLASARTNDKRLVVYTKLVR